MTEKGKVIEPTPAEILKVLKFIPESRPLKVLFADSVVERGNKFRIIGPEPFDLTRVYTLDEFRTKLIDNVYDLVFASPFLAGGVRSADVVEPLVVAYRRGNLRAVIMFSPTVIDGNATVRLLRTNGVPSAFIMSGTGGYQPHRFEEIPK